MFGGRYEVIARAGSGGMAEVYRARDELLGREVAIKVLSERFSQDNSFVERFRREAQAAANLSHPNIVSLYDYGADDGTYFIVMEFIEGKSLADIIAAEGALMPERAADIAAEVAAALQRAHAAGLVHRDIKPGNIMITSAGQTKVTDFGIARAVTRDGEATMTQTGMVIGTAAYLSPEQAQGNPVDARSDVYALGCVLFEMLTGRTPFAGDTPLSIAYKHVRENVAPPSETNPDVPRELDAIVLKAMAKNPDNRYASATEMQEDLQRYLGGQTPHATPLLADDTAELAAAAGGTQVMRRPDTAVYPAEAERRRRGAGFWILLSLLILAMFGGLAWLLLNNLLGQDAGGGATRVEVPRVVGRQLGAARALLEERGLVPEVRRTDSREAPANEVIRQNPEAGRRVAEDSSVRLLVSSGPP
ncbi:MAG TPA: Stk1 family PASTA domain-containing Ser/Thr kinase, partial [Dehalococcoidia bacterium]|nr:Stk1 family PASTA domain-containing Ser/Thr kinase [Dehalococcoidia bacterium]